MDGTHGTSPSIERDLRHLPQPHGAVLATTDQLFPVRSEGDAKHRTLVRRGVAEFASVDDAAQAQAAVAAARYSGALDGRSGDRRNAGGGVVEEHALVSDPKEPEPQ